ncbi:MAG: M1 family aminopeptidase [Ilumatobacter sp.]|nr:M1 family aminopeptidase [Ilumatobacter sp.]
MPNCLIRGSLGRTGGAATLLVVLAGCGGATVTPSSSEVEPVVTEGVSWALAERRAATLSHVEYAFQLTVPREREAPIVGTVVTQFGWEDVQGRDLVLDFLKAEERVIEVRANGASVVWRTHQDHLIVPASALLSGERNEVAVEFTAGDDALNRSDAFLYTLFVPDRAHFSLPLFDQPNLKARFSLSLDVPDDWQAVANGPALDPTPSLSESANRAVYQFAPTEPISTYLFAFAVGDFQVATSERDGRMLRMFYRETDVETVARNRDAIFDLHAASLAWLEDYTQIEYPFAKFDFVLLPPFQYGGMEHPGAVFYRESSLLLEESATQGQFLGRASLIAHETAHMWFGDLVTMNWFDDVWTKEVFANFMAAKIVHPSFPEVNHDLRFFLAHHDSAYAVDRTTGANPIRQPLENLGEAGALYGPIIYEKAPIVMRHLERLVGEEPFRDGLREYLDTFRYDNATWPDLIEILDARSDLDLAAWSAAWVEEPGRPVVDVVIESGPRTTVTLHQADPNGRGRLWPQELELLLAYDEEYVRLPASLSAASVTVDVGAVRDAPRFVLPNAAGLEYGQFRLDDGSRDALLTALPGLTDPLVRGIGWATLWDEVLDGGLAPDVWVDRLLAGLAAETVEQNTQRLLGYLSTTYWRFLSAERRALREGEVEDALWLGMLDSQSPTLKATYFHAWRRIVWSDAGVARMQQIWSGDDEVPGVTLSETDFVALAEELALREVPDLTDVLDQQADRIENADRLARFLFVRPALSPDPEVRAAFFRRLADPSEREREPWVVAAVAYLHHPTRVEHARQFIEPSLDMLVEIQRTGDIFFPSNWLSATLGGHGSEDAAATVRAFLDAKGPDYPARLREKVLQAADLLFRASSSG